MAVDLETLLNWSAGIYVATEGSWRDGISDTMVGSGVNADAGGNRKIDVTQYWYQHLIFEGKLRVRVGKLDLGGGFECGGSAVAFDGSDYAGDETTQFLNDNVTGIANIPFPDPGLGVVIHYNPSDLWYVSIGAADAQADARETGFSTTFHDEDYFFYALETGITPDIPSAQGPLHGAYRIGCWYDPQDKERASGTTKRDDMGFYINCDQIVIRESDDQEGCQGLGLFAKYGYAHSDVSEVTDFWSLGGQYQGLLPDRDDDVLAFGVAQSVFSDQFSDDFTEDSETVMEIYYNALVTASDSLEVTITPSVQHIKNPGGDQDVKDATVLALRAQVSF